MCEKTIHELNEYCISCGNLPVTPYLKHRRGVVGNSSVTYCEKCICQHCTGVLDDWLRRKGERYHPTCEKLAKGLMTLEDFK